MQIYKQEEKCISKAGKKVHQLGFLVNKKFSFFMQYKAKFVISKASIIHALFHNILSNKLNIFTNMTPNITATIIEIYISPNKSLYTKKENLPIISYKMVHVTNIFRYK